MIRWFLLGLACSVVAGLVYFLALHQSGTLFYPFAALAFLGGPALAAVLAGRAAPRRSVRVPFLTGGSVFVSVTVLFLAIYMVWPQFQGRSVRLPESCSTAGSIHPPPELAYTIPGRGAGVLVNRSAGTAVVAIPGAAPPYPSTVYVIDIADRQVLTALAFPNDAIMAGIDGGIVYLYNDKIGAFINARTGAFTQNLMTMDNYTGLSRVEHPVFMNQPGDAWWVEKNAVISSWGVDGSVRSLSILSMNAIAFKCYVDGASGRVTAL